MKRGRGAAPLDAYALLAIPAAVALGAITLDIGPRHAVIWGATSLLCVVYACLGQIELDASLGKVARGAMLGLVISVPILALLPRELLAFWERVHVGATPTFLYYQACFVAAPVSEIVFRGIVWEQKGPQASIILFLVFVVLLYAPHVPLVATLALVIGYGLMGIVLAYTRRQHGLAASIACHVAASLVMIVMPGLIAAVRVMLA